MDDLVRRQDAIDTILADKIDAISLKVMTALGDGRLALTLNDACDRHIRVIEQLPSVQPESTKTFVELVVKYPDPELCAYKEYKGKPYYSIKYIENGEAYVGYGTYNPEVLSQYLKKYFMPSVQPEPDIIACGDCKHWICHDKRCGYWNHGVKPLDWCCHGERRTDG